MRHDFGLHWVVPIAGMLLLTACVSGTGPGMQRADTPSAREDAARIHTELGQNYLREGKLELALNKLQTALSFDPDYAPAHTVLGALYTQIGKTAKAEAEYRRAAQIKPKDGDTNNNLGVFLCREGKTQEGMLYLQRAVDDPFYKTPVTAWTNAGICQITAGQYKAAEAKLDKALHIDPQYPEALYQMAKALHLEGDDFRASAYVQRYQAVGKPDPRVLKLGYVVEARLGNLDIARDYARQLHSKFPDSKQARAVGYPTSP